MGFIINLINQLNWGNGFFRSDIANKVINQVSIKIKNELSEIIIPTIKRFLKINETQI